MINEAIKEPLLVNLIPGVVDGLKASLAGDVIQPGDEAYEEARGVWNGLIDKYPLLIIRCANSADVIKAVNFARTHDLPLSVRGGGHNVAGYASNNGGVVIDLSSMRRVTVDPQARIARAEGGATIADVDRATQLHGLAAPLGVVSETGIAGLTLGGGMGWLRRKHGLSSDNLIGADVVTASGRLVHTSETENPDLLWGLRGGGGNFGIVTSFEYRLHPVGPEVMFASVMYPLSSASKVVRAWREFVSDAPEEISSQAQFWSIPAVDSFPQELHGQAVVIIVALYSGDVKEGQRILQPLRELDTPLLDLSGPVLFTEVQKLYDAFLPKSLLRYYWKSLDLDRLDDEVIESIIRLAEERPSPRTLFVIWHQGGAMSRIGATETAFGDRSAPYLFSLDATWEDPADDDLNISWTRRAWREMHTYSGGGLYLNFPGLGEENDSLVQAAYGENYKRLVALKDKFDPHNLFRFNQNIRPSNWQPQLNGR